MVLQTLTLALLTAPLDSAVVRDIEVPPGETLRTTSVGRGEPLVLIPGIFGAAFGFRSIVAPLVAQGVIREYTAGQTADLSGSIDAFKQMSKSKGQYIHEEQPAAVVAAVVRLHQAARK
jgi:hypothetical protein